MAAIPTGDRQIVDAVLSGDHDAYRILVERESSSVVGLCTRILHDRDEAEDVAQEAFVQAYRSIAGYRGDGTFGAWIGRIATRMAIGRAVSLRQRVTAATRSANAVAPSTAGPEHELINVEQSQAIRRAIDELPADQGQVLKLRFYQDMPLEQIAIVTRAPLGTVKSRLHRGLARLRGQRDLRSVS